MGPEDLAQVLRHLTATGTPDPSVLVGLDAPDDAAIYRIDDDVALVQTVDFFTPVVDVPYDWGAIAAANAMSDVYAMGGKPVTALSLVAWPKEMDMSALGEVLQGAADKAAEAGVSIVGGHSIDDAEPKFGLAVTGLVHPEKYLAASTAVPGMALVLTKPLGSGIAATAIKKGLATPGLIERVTSVMSSLNRGAAEAIAAVCDDPREVAVTDVTGFGLLGHLLNMLRLSGVSGEVHASEVPVLDEIAGLAAMGAVPDGSRRNEAHYGASVEFGEAVDDDRRTVLFDAQTSGGLLIAVVERKVDALLDKLEEAGTLSGSVIGSVTAGQDGMVAVRP